MMDTKGLQAKTSEVSKTSEVFDGFKETEIGPIPVEWEIVPLRDIGEVITGRTPSTKDERYWNGSIPFITPVDLQGGLIRRAARTITEAGLKVSRALPQGTVAVSCIGYIGKVGVVDSPVAVTNQQINAVIVHKTVADNWYLAYTLMQLAPILNSRARVTTVPILNKSNFRKILIPLPPLPEQRRIAHVLSTIQRAIEAQDALIAAAREVKRSLMHHLFTYGPVPLGQAGQVPLKETEIGPVPAHWEVVRLGDVLQTTQYGLSVRADRTGRYPMLRMNNLVDGCIDVSELKYVDLDEGELRKFRVHKGDVLFNRTNSYELVGKTAFFDLEGGVVFASYLIRVVPDTAQLLPEYLNYYLNWDNSQRRLKMLATRGVSQSNISATKLKRFLIGLPSLAEQEEVIGTLSKVDRKIEAEENRKAVLQALFKTMLHQLMTGQVRVGDWAKSR